MRRRCAQSIGRRTLRDLTVDYVYAFRAFSPQFVAETTSALEMASASFLETSPLRGDGAGGSAAGRLVTARGRLGTTISRTPGW